MEYPAGYSKTDRAILRRKCRDNFKLEDGLLYYRKRLLVSFLDMKKKVTIYCQT